MADETKPENDLATRLAKLEADLEAERTESKGLRDTLKTLEADRRAASGGNRPVGGSLVRLSRQEAQALADELGGDWTPEVVQQNYAVIERMFRHAAEPVLRGMSGVADVVDLLQTRQEMPDFKESLAEEAEKVRQEHIQRGEFISRKKAAALVKAQRLEDPAYRDKLADERIAAREAEKERQEAERVAAQTEGTTAATQTAGPGPTKGQRAAVTPESFDKMPLDEKRKFLDDAGIAF